MENIYPIFDITLSREAKEDVLGQRSIAIWLIGLSGSGKSTLAKNLESRLHTEGYFTKILDGDNLRTGINKNLGFQDADRMENVRRVAEVAKLFVNNGIITITSLICPTKKMREMAKAIIGESDYFEVFVDCDFEECEKRDPKGLYQKARNGDIKQFTGMDSVFEVPDNSQLTVRTDIDSISKCTDLIIGNIIQHIRFEI
ncbi:MAG: adenylyl-sulfate kinase [Sporocytophaga sp.]|uniref:adenylyl-sulfate kinase n=1 Tax=Sporocytophaga sp. TaxID=2231183 RepID=UPI001B284894|nr:adenylyl-sulfate kinase [Sporocytophaga sp.]MBO9699287.1 adenylyl-sulfate kinase [Sporocytophaga sp.]